EVSGEPAAAIEDRLIVGRDVAGQMHGVTGDLARVSFAFAKPYRDCPVVGQPAKEVVLVHRHGGGVADSAAQLIARRDRASTAGSLIQLAGLRPRPAAGPGRPDPDQVVLSFDVS